jgi:hypothetical protein
VTPVCLCSCYTGVPGITYRDELFQALFDCRETIMKETTWAVLKLFAENRGNWRFLATIVGN